MFVEKPKEKQMFAVDKCLYTLFSRVFSSLTAAHDHDRLVYTITLELLEGSCNLNAIISSIYNQNLTLNVSNEGVQYGFLR